MAVHSFGKYTPWYDLNSLGIDVLQIDWASKAIDDQNVNLQTEWIKWGSNISLKEVLFQIKDFLS